MFVPNLRGKSLGQDFPCGISPCWCHPRQVTLGNSAQPIKPFLIRNNLLVGIGEPVRREGREAGMGGFVCAGAEDLCIPSAGTESFVCPLCRDRGVYVPSAGSLPLGAPSPAPRGSLCSCRAGRAAKDGIPNSFQVPRIESSAFARQL